MGVYRRLLRGSFLILSSVVAIATVAVAEATPPNLIFNCENIKSFERLIQTAEELAEQAIAKEFRENPNLTEFTLIVSAECDRHIVPLMRSRVSRVQWENDATVDRWTRYFPKTEILLGFVDSEPSRGNGNPINPRRSLSIEDDPGYRDD